MVLIEHAETASLVLGAAIFLFLPIELWRMRQRGELNRRAILEMVANLSPFLPSLAVSGLVISIAVALFSSVEQLTPLSWPDNVWSLLACLVLVDLLYYVDHRCGHRVRAYWAISHSVHHSSPLYNQTTGIRVSFVDGFLSIWFYLPAILAGFSPLMVGACFGLIIAYQQWLHTDVIDRLGWFDLVFNSPSNHRVHHGIEPDYIDKNYGAILIVWDRLFGTYAAERQTPTYGLTEPINSINPVTVHFAEAGNLWRDLVAEPSWRVRWRLLLGPPGPRRQDMAL